MPRYLIKFEDGSEQEMGFPGPHSDRIQQTAMATAEKNTGKKVASLQLAKGSNTKKTKTKAKPKAQAKGKTTSKSSIGKGNSSKSKKKLIGGIKKGKATLDDSSIKVQINNLENALTDVIQQLGIQIGELKTSILLAKKQELLNQLDEIDSQL